MRYHTTVGYFTACLQNDLQNIHEEFLFDIFPDLATQERQIFGRAVGSAELMSEACERTIRYV